MIRSAQNPKIKLIRALQGRAKERREAGAFLAEGARLVEDALRAHWNFRFTLYDDSLNPQGKAQVNALRARGAEVEEISAALMKSISETETPQGILAVLTLAAPPLPEAPSFLLIPDQIRDPGNLGTLLRSAAAAGVDAVLIPPDTTDPFAPKVVRAGMGAHFRLPIHSQTWEQIHAYAAGLEMLLADMGGEPCWQANLKRPLALVVGGEANGAGAAAQHFARRRISIPMRAEVESLNAGVAGGVLMFEVARQRAAR